MDFEDIPGAEGDEYVTDVAPPVPEPFLPDPDPIEEDALTIFNKQWSAKLEGKRAKEFEHEKAVRAQAQEELASWRQQRDARQTAKHEINRTEEAVKKETMQSEETSLKPWDRIPKLIDNSESLPGDSKGSDVSRMRKLFIQIKNEPLEMTRAATAMAN